MTDLTPEGERMAADVAQRHAVSTDAVRAVLGGLFASGGGMVQFTHRELGGMGQWSRGGMVMIGDMFNSGLKGRVDALCSELSGIAGKPGVFADHGPARAWWPTYLGAPASSGGQNDMRYACFPAAKRLAIDLGGQISVYDTGEHVISGFSQQQSHDQSLSFTSQHGPVTLGSLTRLSG